MTRAVLAILAVLAVGAGACTLFDDELPDTRCTTTDDCFEAQGEVCDPDAHVCVTRDAGVL